MSKKYNVHIYPVFRFTLENVEAETPEEAIQKARAHAEQARLLSATCYLVDTVDHRIVEAHYAEDITSYVVDLVGDSEFKESTTFEDAVHVAGIGAFPTIE